MRVSLPCVSQGDKRDPRPVQQARQYVASAELHERKVAQHEESAAFLEGKGEVEHAAIERRNADLERDWARDDWDRANALQGETQPTQPKQGEPVEIPVPDRKQVDDFIRGVAGKDAPVPKK